MKRFKLELKEFLQQEPYSFGRFVFKFLLDIPFMVDKLKDNLQKTIIDMKSGGSYKKHVFNSFPAYLYLEIK